MKAGFGWEHGPFQIWDAIGLDKGLAFLEQEGQTAALGNRNERGRNHILLQR